MSIIFPSDPENPNQNPDHRSIPSPAAEAVKPTTFAVVAVLASSLPLCPEVHQHHEHLPEIVIHRGSDLPASLPWLSSGSSVSGVPNGWLDGNSMEAANVIIRNVARRNRLATAFFGSTPAVLVSHEGSD